MAPRHEGTEEQQWRDEFRQIGLPSLDHSVKFDYGLWQRRRELQRRPASRERRRWAWSVAAAALIAILVGGTPLLQSLGRQLPVTTMKKGALRAWKVGSFTLSTWLLPKVYNPQDPGWQSFGIWHSALYYVPKSAPSELVEVGNGQTQVVAKLSCATQGQVSNVGGPYLFVECGASGGKREGILADAKTGTTWTLWQGGAVPIGTTYVGGGWAYFFATSYENGPVFAKGAINLETGARGPLPSIMSGSWGSVSSTNGALYVEKFTGSDMMHNDLYRIDGLTATLVAHLASPPSGIGANGTIWVPETGGSLTPYAGSMTIRVWTPRIHATKVLSEGPGYVIYLGPTAALGANGPIRVTLATSGGSRTITIGNGNVGNSYSVQGYLIFPGSHGRWQLVTVSGG